MAAYLACSWAVRLLLGGKREDPYRAIGLEGGITGMVTPTNSSSSNNNNSSQRRAHIVWCMFLLGFSLVFLGVLHGASGLFKILVILAGNYVLTKILGASAYPAIQRAMPFVLWAYAIAVLFLNDLYSGYDLTVVFPALGFLVGTLERAPVSSIYSRLVYFLSIALHSSYLALRHNFLHASQEQYRGLIPRWYINFNITMLRMISFAMDYYWSKTEDPDVILVLLCRIGGPC